MYTSQGSGQFQHTQFSIHCCSYVPNLTEISDTLTLCRHNIHKPEITTTTATSITITTFAFSLTDLFQVLGTNGT